MKNHIKKSGAQGGFTILELMIAMTVFTTMLMICLVTFLQVGRLFSKGVNMSLVQTDAREITDSISSDIKFSNQIPTTHTPDQGISWICVGNHVYAYKLNEHLVASGGYGLVRWTATGCPDPATFTAKQKKTMQQKQMMGTNMQLNQLDVKCPAKLCTVSINLLFYGADPTVFTSKEHSGNTQIQHKDAASDPDAQCTGSLAGSQYCATATYSETVLESF